MSKNNKIPPYILCPTPDLARQVLEKIHGETGLRWKSGITESEIKNNLPLVFHSTGNCFETRSIEYFKGLDITNFTKAEDFLLSDETKIRLEELDNQLDKLVNDMTNKTWETLSVGDILIDSNDLEVAVLAVIGRIIFISEPDNYDESNCYYTSKELIEMGYKIKGASEQKPSIDDAIDWLEDIDIQLMKPAARVKVLKAIEMLKRLK